jgi:MSHA biogenesis protein MshL
MVNYKLRFVPVIIGLSLLVACNLAPVNQGELEEEGRHITISDVDEATNIPEIVRPLPVVTQPQLEAELDLYSVVVQGVSVRELLFAMARDADINIDVHTAVDGVVSINAIDQTLPQILDRISRQVDIRWGFERADYLVVELDTPILRSYHIDYVNVARSSISEVSVSSAVTSGIGDGGGSEDNNSTTVLSQSSTNDFWLTLRNNLNAIIGVDAEGGDGDSGVVVSSESGLVTVRATSRQHDDVYAFIESVRTRALYQVLIEATVVEVNLNDSFQSGVDWALLARDNGQVSFGQDLIGLNLNTAPTNFLTIDKSAGPDAVNATIRMLSQFGDTQVLSSPKLMALNNQTAMLRVVDNKIYFTGNKVCLSQVPGSAAIAIDTELDDSLGATGRLRATLGAGGTNTAPSNAVLAAVYSEDNVYTLCYRF